MLLADAHAWNADEMMGKRDLLLQPELQTSTVGNATQPTRPSLLPEHQSTYHAQTHFRRILLLEKALKEQLE